MRSGLGEAELFRGVAGRSAPHNPEGEGVRRLARGEAPRVGQRDQMSLCSPFSPETRVA